MKTLTVFSALLSLFIITACSSTPGGSSDSSPASITKDQVRQQRAELYFEKGSATPYTGDVVDYYYEGGKKLSMNLENGLPVGPILKWYRNGQMRSSETMDGEKTGVITRWHENGQMQSHRNFLYGYTDGLYTTWYESGQKSSEESYFVDGKPTDGTDTKWYMNGQKRSEEIWTNGRSRCSTEWDEAGNVESEYGSACKLPTFEQASVGVLPFRTQWKSDQNSEAADSIAESLREDIENRGVTVASPEEIASLEPERGFDSMAGEQLGVTHILHGVVGINADSIRIGVELTLVENNFALWTKEFDRSLQELPDIQTEIGSQVFDLLNAE